MFVEAVVGFTAVCFSLGAVGGVRAWKATTDAFRAQVRARGFVPLRGRELGSRDGKGRVRVRSPGKARYSFVVDIDGHPLASRTTIYMGREIADFDFELGRDIRVGDAVLDAAWRINGSNTDVVRGVARHPAVGAALEMVVAGCRLKSVEVDAGGCCRVVFHARLDHPPNVEACIAALAAGFKVADAFAEARDALPLLLPGSDRGAGHEGSPVGVPSVR